jgi:L-ribulose-5-phosphate 3-epimerase
MTMHRTSTRRDFIRTTALGAAAAGLGGAAFAQAEPEAKPAGDAAGKKRDFKISLAGWSLHRTVGRGGDKPDMLEMPKMTKEEFGIEAIELVSGMLSSTDDEYFAQLKQNAEDHGVKILLIMVDGQGNIGAEEQRHRDFAVKRHTFWIDQAAMLGCHSIRMNWKGEPKGVMENEDLLEEFINRSAPAFRELCAYGDGKDINVLLENHWGPSSYPHAVEKLVAAIDHPRFGTLPDFGNFPEDVDKYDAVDRLMPFAKALSAKCYDFDPETGEDTKIDFERMLEICVDKHGYHGYIGIEYEGSKLSEPEGIKAAKALLEKYRG